MGESAGAAVVVDLDLDDGSTTGERDDRGTGLESSVAHRSEEIDLELGRGGPAAGLDHWIEHGPEHMIEFAHGYTYSSHPLACAAALGTLATYEEEGLLTRASELQGYFADAVHSLRGEPNVIDIRNIGLVAGIELAPIAGSPAKRAFDIFLDCYERGVLIRTTGDTLALSPPLIIERSQIDQIVDTVRGAIRRHA